MSLLFMDEHIPKIRSGEKTATRRLWDEDYNRPNEGTIQMAITELLTPEAECDCFIRIEEVYRQPLGEMEAADFEIEGGYSREEFEQLWRHLNGAWDDGQVVDVVEFEYVGRDRPVGDGGTPL